MGPEIRQDELELSHVTKVTSVVREANAKPDSVRPEGPYYVAAEPNSFGLPSLETCPGSTDTCEEVCYAHDSEGRTATHEKMMRNLDTLKKAETVDGMTEKIRNLVTSYEVEADLLGVEKDKRRFRIHWDGDFFSVDYAKAWANVINEKPDLKFYVYTRSFQEDVNVIPTLYGIENLDLFMSVDRDNVDRAAEVVKDYPDVRIGYLVDYEEEAGELIDKLGRRESHRQLTCPENMYKESSTERRLSLLSKRGGACSRCTYCIDKPNSWDVVFVIKHLEFRAQGLLDIGPVPVEISRKPRQKPESSQPIGTLALAEAQASFF